MGQGGLQNTVNLFLPGQKLPKAKQRAKRSQYLEVKHWVKDVHSRTFNRQFYNQVPVLHSKQTPELLEEKEGNSSAHC